MLFAVVVYIYTGVLLATEEVVSKEGGFLTPASGLGPKLITRLNNKDMPIILDPEDDAKTLGHVDP